jgi:hypothetical protein
MYPIPARWSPEALRQALAPLFPELAPRLEAGRVPEGLALRHRDVEHQPQRGMLQLASVAE